MIRTLQTAVISLAFLSVNVFAQDYKPKPKPKPEATKDAKAGKGEDHKADGHKGKDHDKKH